MMRLYDYLPSASTRRVGSYLPRAAPGGSGKVRFGRSVNCAELSRLRRESVGMTRRVG